MTPQQKKNDGPNVDLVNEDHQRAQERGYFGERADPRPLEEHSLESGPAAPSAVEQMDTMRTAAPPSTVAPGPGESTADGKGDES